MWWSRISEGTCSPNLTQKNFRVFEDKVEQKVSNFSPQRQLRSR